MSSAEKKLSDVVAVAKIRNAGKVRIAVIVSEWSHAITSALCDGCLRQLAESGVKKKNIEVLSVPGSFELPSAANMILKSDLNVDAIVCLGCVIQGETRHFDFICNAVANGIMDLNVRYTIPVIFGVLTTNNLQEAKARAGGKHGNKGIEAAAAALQMISLKKNLKMK